MKPLEPPDSHHLTAACGWLELGDHLSANDELELISAPLRAHPVVLVTRCEIYAKAKKWDAVLTIAETLVKMMPEESSGWIQRSFALHELKRTQEAFDFLFPAAEKFSTVPIIPYNLACYCAQLGLLKNAEVWLTRSFEIGDAKELKLMALDDPDLEPLWKGIPDT